MAASVPTAEPNGWRGSLNKMYIGGVIERGWGPKGWFEIEAAGFQIEIVKGVDRWL